MTKAEKQREYRLRNGNLCTKKYEKTKKGFLMRTYRNMQSRVTGVQWRKAHLYLDKSLLDRETFYNLSLRDPTFNLLFEKWESSGYTHKITPSIDRLDVSIGYEIGNLQWITHSENSRKGAISRHSKSGTL